MVGIVCEPASTSQYPAKCYSGHALTWLNTSGELDVRAIFMFPMLTSWVRQIRAPGTLR
jgi:hypothetical protein